MALPQLGSRALRKSRPARAPDPCRCRPGAAFAEPFRVVRPARQTPAFRLRLTPFGADLSRQPVARSRLDALTLRRSEDAFVDELFAGVTGLGAPLIAARFPRAYCDVNRAPGELDAGDVRRAAGGGGRCARARGCWRGWASFRASCATGRKFIARKLTPERSARRGLTLLYRPYHAALGARWWKKPSARFGVAVVVDCHSMPSALAVPDIVLGDRYGASAPPPLTGWAENAFAGAGFSMVRNSPYAGGYTTTLYGRGAAACHALQIEINRSLYLEEDTHDAAAGFEALQEAAERGAGQTDGDAASMLPRGFRSRRSTFSSRLRRN